MDLELRLLGEFSLATGAGQELEVRASKTRALLALLALAHNRRIERDEAAHLLWPDRGLEQARASLRQAIATLRRSLPAGAVEAGRQAITLHPEVWVDVLAFDQSIQNAASRASGLALYRGELLQSLQTNSQAFTDWRHAQAQSLRSRAVRAAQQELEAAADDVAAIAACEQLLVLDPLQESVHRELMRRYADQGQVGSALRQFRLCRDLFERELGVPPEPETVAVMQSIREGRSNTQASSAQTPASLQTSRLPALPTIAVLPFVSQSDHREDAYLADGMTDELINLMTHSVNWRVTARHASFNFKGHEVDVREVGRELGVAYVVEGTIRRSGDRIRVAARLIDASDGIQIWSQRYDEVLGDIFQVQDQVVHDIFRALKNRLGFAERERVRRVERADLNAWGLLVRSNQITVTSRESCAEQQALIYEALSIDPAYPRAHAFLANNLLLSVVRGQSQDHRRDMVEGIQHADKALETAGTDPLVLRTCAGAFGAIGQAKRAMALAQRSFEIHGDADALFVAALMWNGRIDEAKKHCLDIVARMVPGLPTPPAELRPIALLGNLYMLEGNYVEAHNYAEQDLLANPGNYFSHVNLANVLGYLGFIDDARRAWRHAVELNPLLTIEGFSYGYEKVFEVQALARKFSGGLIDAGVEETATT